MGSHDSQPLSYAATVLGNKARRRLKQSDYEEDYKKAITTITDKIRDLEGPDIKETMKDQIRQWFIECQWDIEEHRGSPGRAAYNSNIGLIPRMLICWYNI